MPPAAPRSTAPRPLPRRSPARALRAFTLIELLITIAVIGILAAFLFPAFQKAGAKARSVRCAQHMRQIGIGMQLYADADPNGFLPGNRVFGQPPIGINPNPSWIYNLTDMVGNVDGLRICPGDALGSLRLTNASSSYVLNQYTSSEARGPTPAPASDFHSSLTDPDGQPIFQIPHIRRLDAIPNPSRTIVLFEGSDLGYFLGDERTHPDTWFFGWDNVLADISPTRHRGAANYLYADWHVESIRANRLRARIESGDNFAVPGR